MVKGNALKAFLNAYKKWLEADDECGKCKIPWKERDCNNCPIGRKWLYWFERGSKLIGPAIEEVGKERVLEEMRKIREGG